MEYFVSYFDYYQPEAYIPRSDTYIEKDSTINDEIERPPFVAMGSVLTREEPSWCALGFRAGHLRPRLAGRLREHDGPGPGRP